MKSEYHRSYSVEWWGYYIGSEPCYHRLDGPAVTYYEHMGSLAGESYYILGIQVSEEDFNTPGFIDAFIVENS
jgi:hypothetical protein